MELVFNGTNIDETLWNNILEECDKDNDGKISKEEFVKLFVDKLS